MSVSRKQPPARPVAANRGDPLSRPVQRPLLQRLQEPRCGLSLGPHEPTQGGELPLLLGRVRQQNVCERRSSVISSAGSIWRSPIGRFLFASICGFRSLSIEYTFPDAADESLEALAVMVLT